VIEVCLDEEVRAQLGYSHLSSGIQLALRKHAPTETLLPFGAGAVGDRCDLCGVSASEAVMAPLCLNRQAEKWEHELETDSRRASFIPL